MWSMGRPKALITRFLSLANFVLSAFGKNGHLEGVKHAVFSRISQRRSTLGGQSGFLEDFSKALIREMCWGGRPASGAGAGVNQV